MTGDDLAVVIPLWRRTKNIDRVTCSLLDTVPRCRIVFVVSDGDHEVQPSQLPGDVVMMGGVGGEPGDYARKINRGYRCTEEPFIFTGADDLVFHEGWYEAARKAMGWESDHPDDLFRTEFGVVGTNDLLNDRTIRGEHSTHSLVARWYGELGGSVDQPDMIYYEGYVHEYCDDELVQTAKMRGAYAHAHGAIVEHVHMLGDPGLDDEVYRHGRSRSRHSRRTYLQRRRLWSNEGAWPGQR